MEFHLFELTYFRPHKFGFSEKADVKMGSDSEDLLGKIPVQDKGERTGEFRESLQIKMLRSEATKKRKKEEGLGRKSYTAEYFPDRYGQEAVGGF